MGIVERAAVRAGIELHRRAGLNLVATADAPKFLAACEALHVRILGFDGFTIAEGCLIPDMAAIADFSDVADAQESVRCSHRVLRQLSAPELLFEFTVDEAPFLPT